ncbi:MAG: aromatic ring-hydroxylating dioxygenase subunit alpha [Chloroflexi bacterium]|nr:aromatic ring-hydroxylating dioxygenase subunit alpha [Chloroflexota bacterium]
MDSKVMGHPYSVPAQQKIEDYYTAMRRFWHPVLPAADLPAHEPIGVELLEEPVVLARLNGEIVAMQDLCRHFQARLSLGEISKIPGAGECLMCPYHGWSYAASGQCVHIPQLTHERQIPADAQVPRYLAAERYGLIWVCLDEKPRFGIPQIPALDDTAFMTGPLRTYPVWQAAAPRAIMAALDDTHGPWVHGGLVGDRSHTAPPEHTVRREGDCMLVDVRMVQPENATIRENGRSNGHGPQLQAVKLCTTVGIPNMIHFMIQAEGSQKRTQIWQAVCPKKYNETLTFWGSARNYDFDQPVFDPVFETMQDTLREQDKRIVESQRPWLVPPFWTKVELPLRPADLPLIEYQRWLEELGITLAL